jgi:S-adenosylmethionine:tRNA ribosyltransferase-isomerase
VFSQHKPWRKRTLWYYSAAMQRSDFYYELPEALIAQFPTQNRQDSRLLHLPAGGGAVCDRQFVDLPDLLNSDDLLVFNDTRVMRARLYGHKASGGRVELLIERVLKPEQGLAHIKASKSPKPGSRILLDGGGLLEVLDRADDLFLVAAVESDLPSLMAQSGHIPLPPYISRDDEALDVERYQTVYSRREDSILIQKCCHDWRLWGLSRPMSLCTWGQVHSDRFGLIGWKIM